MSTAVGDQPPTAPEVNEKQAPLTSGEASGPSAESSKAPSELDTKPVQEGMANLTTAENNNNNNQAEQVPSGPVKTPFPHPVPTAKPAPPPELTAEQKCKYDELLALVKSWTDLPDSSAKNAPRSALTADERMWLTRECLLRYLRAVKWASATAAAKRITETLVWRREYGVYGFTAEYISAEQETGKQVILGYDNEGRPCLYLRPNQQNTPKSDRQLHHLVFMLERVIDLMPPGQETTALLIDFKESSSGQNPSVSQGKQVLSILQNHYPERLGRALISHLPWYVTTFFKLISPFIDPVTKTKMKFNEPLAAHVPPAQLWSVAEGGACDFVYDHAVYWPALNQLCDERRAAYRARWERAGAVVGESEVFLRGGEEGSVGAAAAE